MTTYTYISDGGLTEKDFRSFKHMNYGANPTGALLRVMSDNGCKTDYVVFKREKIKGQKSVFHGTVTDWDKDSVVIATYSRFLKISKADGTVLDNDFSI